LMVAIRRSHDHETTNPADQKIILTLRKVGVGFRTERR